MALSNSQTISSLSQSNISRKYFELLEHKNFFFLWLVVVVVVVEESVINAGGG
jgi:hypothetical protein